MNLCYLDVETSGLDPCSHAILQIAGIIELNGEPIKEFNLRLKPASFHKIDPKALAINGITPDQLMEGLSQADARAELMGYLMPYSRLTMIGYNVMFDKGFVQEWLGKSFSAVFEYKPVDVYSLAYLFAHTHCWPVANHKLSTICAHLGIELQAHDALADIHATRKVFAHLQNLIKG